jgi:type II secretory pathway component PulF
MERRSILNKKGMALGDMYPAVLMIVLVGIVLGVGLYVLTNFTLNLGTSADAQTAVNTTITGLGTFADWIAIIVVVIAAAIVLGVVLSSFGQKPSGI